jgi:hypothetical protein
MIQEGIDKCSCKCIVKGWGRKKRNMKKPNFSGPGIICHRSGLFSWSDGNKEVYFSKYTPDKRVINMCWFSLSFSAKRRLGHHTPWGVNPPKY